MTKQEKAVKHLKQLRGTGISYKGFAAVAQMSVDSIYTYTRFPEKMTEEKADYIESVIEIYFPVQLCAIRRIEANESK